MNSKHMICSFCDLHENDVDRLLQGPRAAICDQCVDACTKLLDLRGSIKPAGIEDNECYVPITNGEFVVFPSAKVDPNGVSYVRWVDARGVEVLYFDSDEWAQDPKTVMGAMMGALLNGGGWDEFPEHENAEETKE